MSPHCALDTPKSRPVRGQTLENLILSHIEEQAVIGLDALVFLMPDYSWSQIFHAVDRLARGGKVTLRRHRFEYTLFSTQYAA
jgi:hypothetical protein